jgi:hypothetical protein
MPSDLIRGWEPVFPRDKREAFARRSCSNKKIERDDDSKKSHSALGQARRFLCFDKRCFDRDCPDRTYFDNTGSGGTLSFGASACMVISVIETRS